MNNSTQKRSGSCENSDSRLSQQDRIASLRRLQTIKEIQDYRSNPCWYFARKYHRNDRGKPLTFDNRPFLTGIYQDDNRWQVYQKSTQCGITERTYCYVQSKQYQGWNIFYIWPKDEARTNFKKRFDRQVRFVPFYVEGEALAPMRANSATLTYFWDGQLKLVGANVPDNMKEFPADMVIVEEFDLCNSENVAEGYHRLDNSEYKYIIKIGNPVVANEGICQEFGNSNQQYWNLKCEHCGEWQNLDWFFNVVRETGKNRFELLDNKWKPTDERDIEIYCRKCHKPMQRFSIGDWVAKYPQRKVSGYQISQLFSGNVTIAEMWNHFVEGWRDNTKAQKFWNNRLGLGYEGAGAKLTHSKLDACCADGYQLPDIGKDCTAGIDTGANCCHWRVSDYPGRQTRRMVWAGTTGLSIDEAIGIIRRLGITCVCIDAHPETHFAKQLRDRLPGIVWMINYTSTATVHNDRLNEDERIITVDRTSSIDSMVAQYEGTAAGDGQFVILPENAKSIEGGDYYKQMCAPTRKFDKDRNSGKGAWIWDEGSKPDHFFHAENYDYLAMSQRPGPGYVNITGRREVRRDMRF